MLSELLTARERAAWRLSEKMKPSEWAERYRVLPPGQSDIPGPWRNDNAPYLRGIMDLAVAPGVVQLNVMKAGQMGVSEGFRNVILYWAHLDPDPMGLGLPDRVKGRQIVGNRIIPAFQTTEILQPLFTDRAWDVQKEQIKLENGFILHLMWAGSPSATSADPMRRDINDEVDKPGFRDWGGAEPNPIGRTWTRLRSFGDRKLQVNISTPTTRFGQIYRLWEGSDIGLQFECPCPKCRKFQTFLFQQLRWAHWNIKDKRKLAARILRENAVWYECAACESKIKPDQKAQMVRRGRWASIDGKIKDAEKVKQWPRGTRIGMQISALYCLWESWANIAAQFIRAEKDRGAIYIFRTETLAQPWEEQVERTRSSLFQEKVVRTSLPQGTVPAWAVKLLATIDTQHDHFYLVIRAWGPEMKSQRVWHGRVETFEGLDDLCFRHPWPNENKDLPPMVPELVLIDSGGTKLEGEWASRTMEVYRWAIMRRARVRAIKGSSRPKAGGIFIWPGKGFLDQGQKRKQDRTQLRIWFLDIHHFGDLLAELISRGFAEGKDEVWLLNEREDDEYNQQMSNVHKIVMQEGSQLIERWIPIESGAADHYWDCENYQVAAAYMAQVHLLPSEKEMEEYRGAEAEERKRQVEDTKKARKERGDAWEPKSLGEYL